MRIKLISVSTLLLLTMFSSAVSADQLFRPRASLGYVMYDIELGSFGTLDSDFLAGGFGATVANDEYYFDFAYTTSLSADYNDEGMTFDFERKDLNLTVGKILQDGLSVFGGYKTGESEFSSAIAWSGFTALSFEAKGPFVGVAKSVPLQDALVSYNAAIAFLSGELICDCALALGTPLAEEADTTGISLGASYTKFLGDNNGIIYKGAYRQYKFSGFSGLVPAGVLPDTKETVLAFEVSYYADF